MSGADADRARPGGGWLPRERLARRVQEALARRLVVVTAPWGAGKSSLLRDLARRLDRSVIRVRMNPNSVDLSFFFWQLLTVLGRPSDGLPSDTEMVMDPLAQVIERVAEQPPLVIALDNAEDLAASAPVLEVVALFAERLPAGSSLLVASRTPLDLPTERLRAHGELAILGPEEFRANEEELRAIVESVIPELSLAPHELDYLCSATEGRLLLVRLFAEAARNAPVSELLERIGRDGISETLVDAVLTEFDDSERHWLEDVSILEELRPPLVDHVAREPERSERRLARASRLHLVEPFEAPRRMPSLVRDVLRRRVAADTERWRALHTRAAEAHRNEGDAEGTFHHLVEAGDVERAIETLIGIGHASIHNRRLDALGRLLDRLDSAVVATNPILLFTRGSLRWVQERPSDALDDLRVVIPMAEGTDLARAARARVAQILSFQGGFREAAATIAPMLCGTLDLEDPLVVTACSSALVSFVHLGREADAQALLDRIDADAVPEAQLVNLRLGQCYAARLHGEPEVQRRLGLEALAAGRSAGITGVMCFMPIHIAEGELGLGRAAAALGLAEEAERASRTMREHWLALAAGEVRVRALQALGRHDEARAAGHAVITGCAALGGAWTEAEVWLSLSRSPGEDRSAALASAEAAAARTDHAELEARIALERARQALDADRVADARRFVEIAAQRLGGVRAEATRFELGLVRARLARACGDAETAREAVRRAGRAGRSFGAERTPLMAELLREALAGEAWAHAEIERAPRAALPHVAPTRSHRTAALRSRLLDLAARPLEVSSLGALKVGVQARADEPEEAVAFRAPRVLDLLLFLLVEGDTRPVPVDVLIDAFWGRAAAGAGSLRTHLTYLRRALEPHAPSQIPSRYLLRTPDGYRVDLRGGHFDAASFRREVAAARAALRREDAERADAAFDRALALYQGEFAPSRPYVDALAGERRRLSLLFEQACLEGARVARGRNAPAVARERLAALLEQDPSHGEAYALLTEWARADGRTAELDVLEARQRATRADGRRRE
jgi:ATP/maltotriose-dependent transcriptional regulator MalT/DNA-binding SARP family transcriptional activator